MNRLLLPLLALLGSVAGSASAQTTPLGDWLTSGASAVVKITPCASGQDSLCGRIVWLWDPATLTDARNSNAALRSRPLIGLEMLSGVRPGASGEWNGGRIYNPEDGNTYGATLKMRDATTLDVRGCVMVFCRSQIWRRPSALPR